MRCYLFTSIAALALLASLGEAVVPPKITVYYESLCPDSIRWINNQLLPTYKHLGNSFNVTLVPYGKAFYSKTNNPDSPYQFSCQHGPAECKGNMAQECGINAIQHSEPVEKVQPLTVELVGCAMEAPYPPTAVPKCVEGMSLKQQTKDAINGCIGNTKLSQELLAKNGELTAALNPRLSFVPTITLNGVNSPEIQNKAYSNLCGLISEQLPEEGSRLKCPSS